MPAVFENDFNIFKYVQEARSFYNCIVLDTLKKYYRVDSDVALAAILKIDTPNLAHVRRGDRCLPFRYIKNMKFDECTKLLIQNAYVLSVCCPLYFDKN